MDLARKHNIKEPLKKYLECLFTVACLDEFVFFCEGALEEVQKPVNETGIHGGCIVEPLLLADDCSNPEFLPATLQH